MSCEKENGTIEEIRYIDEYSFLETTFSELKVTIEGALREEWEDLSVSFDIVNDSMLSYRSYSLPKDSLASLVWPEEGNFLIRENKIDRWLRNDGVEMDVLVYSPFSIHLGFTMYLVSLPCDTSIFVNEIGVADTSIACPLDYGGYTIFQLKK